MFSPSGSFSKAKTYLAEQANKAMHVLLKRVRNLNLPIDLQLKLFDQTILPILTFSCETWGMENNIECLERIHLSFLRKITNSKKSTPAYMYMLYGELKRFPLKVTVFTRMINYWIKLVTANPNKYSSFAYRAMMYSNTCFKWLDSIKNIFNSTGLSYIFDNQINISIRESKSITKLVKQCLVDQFIQGWHESKSKVKQRAQLLSY